MSVEFSKIRAGNIREEPGTPGGTTYFVKLPANREEKAICFRRMHKDHALRCTNPAGYKTWHVGTGACAFHGGNTSANPNIRTGRTAFVTRTRLNDQIQEYLNQDRGKLLNLDYELATAKAIYAEMVSLFPEPGDDNYGIWLNRFLNVIGSIGTLVEKISRTDARNTLTAAQVLLLRATVADLFSKYITDPNVRERAARELAARLGGEVAQNVDMRRSEVYLPDYSEVQDG
jgi:hypothetical protein